MVAVFDNIMGSARIHLIILTFVILHIEKCEPATCADTMEFIVKFIITEDKAKGSLVGNITSSFNSNLGPPYKCSFFMDESVVQMFDIDYNTGIIKTKDKLDREINETYSFYIMKDTTMICVNILVLDVNDCVPIFSNSHINLSIPEGAPNHKISIGSAVDQDIGQNTIAGYKLVSGNIEYAFNITSRLLGPSNQTLLLDLGVNGTLDFELTCFYSLIIEIYDGGNPSFSSTMTIDINVLDLNDNSPIFNHSKYSAAIMENTTLGTSLLEVHATDIDSGNNGKVRYSIDNATDPDQFFMIDPITGIIYLNRRLDYEMKRSYKIFAVASDSGVQPNHSPAVVEIEVLNVNELPANIYVTYLTADATPTVYENVSVGYPVARVAVSDPESPDISVSLQGSDGYFNMESTGSDTYTLCVAKALDRETKAIYNLVIIVTDLGFPSQSAKKYIFVHIGDNNDNAPHFHKNRFAAELDEISEPGASVITVTATDYDIGENANIKYHLQAANTDKYREWFQVDSVSGLVTTLSQVDCEVDSQPSFWIVASDQGKPPLSSSALIVINIRDTNDKEPVFDHSIYYASVNEDITFGTCILQVNATDLDCGVNGQIHYSIVELSGSPGSNWFYIEEFTGEICVNQLIDYETYQIYQFSVVARDTGNLYSLANIHISILDVNDHFPEFYPYKYSKNIQDTVQPNSEIVTVQATDGDTGLYGKVQYSIYQGNLDGNFNIDSTTGIIKVVSSLPAGERVYRLLIDAHDGGGLAAQQRAEVIISVRSPGRNPPQFERSMYRFTISEAAAVDTIITTVKATYNGSSNEIDYSITSGDKKSFFNIELRTGIIHIAKTLDHDEFPSLLLNVMATTSSNPGLLFAYSQVNITIEDINDNAPVFTSSHVTTYISEAISSMVTIYVAHATDKDSRANGNGEVRYRLGSPVHLFMIDTTSGELCLASGQQLDYETAKHYDIIIIAYDQGQSVQLSSSMTLSVYIQDANDNPPVFSSSRYVFNVSEALPISYKFAQVVAKDNDREENGRITFRLKELEFASKFGIFPSDGVLYLKDKVDFEMRAQYTLTVIARDHGQPALSATAIITVNVIDYNDNIPMPTQSEYYFYVEENRAHGFYVGMVTATDADSGNNGKLQFYFNNAQTDFSISNNGVIQTLHSLDRELVPEYVIDVTIEDSGIPVLQASVRVYIMVTDVNDHAPAIQNSNNTSIQAFVNENQSKGMRVVQIIGWDPDAGLNGTVTFSLQNDGDTDAISSFAIHPVSGWITTKEVLDYEVKATYKLKIVVVDLGSPSLSITAGLVIHVNNDDKETEILQDVTNSSLTFYVVENTPTGTTVCNVEAYDREAQYNGRVFYYIVGGNTFGLFAVELLTGNVYTIRAIDYEEASSHTVVIKAIDNSVYNPSSTIITIKIYVLDTNDNPPLFDFDPVFLSLKENTAVNTVIKVFTATDADSGVNGTVQYKIIHSSTDNVMYIDTNTGQLCVSRNIDYEQVQEILLIISATDQCPSRESQLYTTLTVQITVLDVNDNAPQFKSYQPLQVYEDEDVGCMLASLVATDADSNMNKSGNNWLTYTIKAGNINGAFHISESTGILTIASPLDRDFIEVYYLVVSARDHGMPYLENNITVAVWVLDVNDNSPRFQQSTYQCNVTENSNSTTLITMLAMDADTGNNSRLTYRIPDGIAKDYFSIDPVTGVVTLATNNLDREQRSSFVMTVYVQDAGYPVLFDMATLIINVMDVNDSPPTFKQNAYFVEISENTILDMVYTFVAQDADIGDNAQVNYSITGGNDEGKFSIDFQTGILSCQKPLDRETVSLYELTITATDGVYDSWCHLYIRVLDQNDNSPVFYQEKYTKFLLENASVGTTVVSVYATDVDEDGNAIVTYSLCNDTDASVFVIDAESGVITTNSLLDREKKDSYSFDVLATDGGHNDQMSARVRVEVTIGDINDNSPVFQEVPYRKEVSISSGANTAILTIVAEDKDDGNNSKVFYTLSSLSDATALNYFQINSLSGLISTKQALSASVSGYHNLKVIATDSGNHPLSSTGVVEISVETFGGGKTFMFPSQNYTTHLVENPPKSYLVIALTISNHSSGVTYSFVSGNDGDAFAISDEGWISVFNPALIDYETSHTMKLTVAAVSGGLYAYTTVWVTLIDVNDNPPVFSQNIYNTKVFEEQSKNAFVMQVTANDADSPGPNSEMIYNIIGGNLDEAFIIYPPNTGIVQTNLIVDYEIRSSYRLIIEARDNGNSTMSGTCIVRISVIDINDNPPKFPNTIPVNISEDADVGTFIAMVTANDVDVSSLVTYNFSNHGNPDSTFSIDQYNCKLYLAKHLDFEIRTHYVVGLQANDGKFSDYVTLNIYVEDRNDNTPVFTQQSYQMVLEELTLPNTKVLMVNATDADYGANAVVSYSLTEVSSYFYINNVTGVIYTSTTIQYRSDLEIIQLVVCATDAGNVRLSAFVAVNIQVTSVNKYPPVFLQQNYTSIVFENADSGTIVIRVEAHDNDVTSRNKEISYSIINGNTGNVFAIDKKYGTITVNSGLDRELVSSYSLIVMATDRGFQPQGATVNVLVLLQDVNDRVPYFELDEYYSILNESFPSEVGFMKINTYDMDTGANSKIYYTITSGNEEGLFIINGMTGELFITPKEHLDYEHSTYHKLVVKATDCSGCMGGTLVFSNITTVHINVTDVNEFSPEFPVDNYVEDFKENNSVGSSVFEAHANDRDGGYYGIVSYTLSGTTMFSINNKTGLVTTNVVFDYETAQQFNFSFQIITTDQGGKSATINVMLYLEDLDEFSPVIEYNSYTYYIQSNIPVGTLIGTVHATDVDKGNAGVVVYKFSKTNGYFSINSATGEIRAKNELNKEIVRKDNQMNYENNHLIVVVSNGMDDSLRSSVMVTINVNWTCPGCDIVQLVSFSQANSYTVIIAVVVVVNVVILSVIIAVMLCKQQYQRKNLPPSETPMWDDEDYDTLASTHKTVASNYNDLMRFNKNNTANLPTSSYVSHRSGSSGRGSVEDDDDEELAMINFNTSSYLINANGFRKNMPDSGIQDDDNTSEPSVQNHHDYLARLGIDTAKISSKAKCARTHSVESMHQFSDSGGGEGDGLENIDYLKLQGSRTDRDSLIDSNNDMGFHEPTHIGGSLSNVINSEEEYTGSYNWDYLLDWGPQYLPLAHVFSEIARLKDDNFQPKKQAVKLVQQLRQGDLYVSHQVWSVPPPMITNVPPQVVGQPVSRSHRSSHSSGVNSMHNSTINTSLPSISRSPISHDSSFTSPALTPSFTSSLSPLATRSPSVSPVNSGRGIVSSHYSFGRNTPRGHPLTSVSPVNGGQGIVSPHHSLRPIIPRRQALNIMNNNKYGCSFSCSEQEVQI